MRETVRKYVTGSGGIYIQKTGYDETGAKKTTWEMGKTDGFLIDAAYVSFEKAKDIAFCYQQNKDKIGNKNKLSQFESKLMAAAKEENFKGEGGLILYIDILEGLGHSSVVKKIVPPFP